MVEYPSPVYLHAQDDLNGAAVPTLTGLALRLLTRTYEVPGF